MGGRRPVSLTTAWRVLISPRVPPSMSLPVQISLTTSQLVLIFLRVPPSTLRPVLTPPCREVGKEGRRNNHLARSGNCVPMRWLRTGQRHFLVINHSCSNMVLVLATNAVYQFKSLIQQWSSSSSHSIYLTIILSVMTLKCCVKSFEIPLILQFCVALHTCMPSSGAGN
jgi:hypothetical protein